LEVLAKGYFSTLAAANHLAGYPHQATTLDRVVHHILGPRVQCIRKMKNKEKKKGNPINISKNEQSTNYWAASVGHQVNMNISWNEKKE
jgi:hypothetical protein